MHKSASREIESFLLAKRANLLIAMYEALSTEETPSEDWVEQKGSDHLQILRKENPSIIAKDLILWTTPTHKVNENGLFSLLPTANNSVVFARVFANQGDQGVQAIPMDDLYFCFQRHHFVRAHQTDSETDFYIELESPFYALQAVLDTDPHPFVKFVAFKGTDYSTSCLPKFESRSAHQAKASSSSKYADENRMTAGFVLDNIPVHIGDKDVRGFLAPYGVVKSIRWSMNDHTGTHNGCALIELGTLESVYQASKALNGAVLGGNHVKMGYVDQFCCLRDVLTHAIIQAPKREASRWVENRQQTNGTGHESESKSIQCFLCGEQGHKMRFCRRRNFG